MKESYYTLISKRHLKNILANLIGKQWKTDSYIHFCDSWYRVTAVFILWLINCHVSSAHLSATLPPLILQMLAIW